MTEIILTFIAALITILITVYPILIYKDGFEVATRGMFFSIIFTVVMISVGFGVANLLF